MPHCVNWYMFRGKQLFDEKKTEKINKYPRGNGKDHEFDAAKLSNYCILQNHQRVKEKREK